MAATYRFGRFEVDAAGGRLLVDGRTAHLGQRGFDLLLALVERRDRLVTKPELFELVWPGLVVEENNLQVQVSALRKLIGAQAIETVPGRGYRFRAALEGTAASSASAPAAPMPVAADLYGRDADLAAVRELLAAHRLVTVLGAGGIGKSRLAQAIAQASTGWPEVRVVELAGFSDPAPLGKAIAQALEVKTTGQPLAAALAPRHALVVLDNCEHLLDAIVSLVETILQAAPKVTFLTTSQEPLHLPQEQQYRLLPLAVPGDGEPEAHTFGAVALFEARVRACDPRFGLTDHTLPLAIEICRQLDGLPLAIELAAARAATLGLRPVRDKLHARFKLLTGGSRAALRRHQTLRAALEWSHNLLDADERTVFRRLGVFAGGFTAELAQAVAADGDLDEWRVLDTLSSLVDKSLVAMDPADPPRYRLLESARAFALEQLAEADAEATLRRHALAMRDFLVRVDDANIDGLLRKDQYATRVLPELDNLRAAFTWAKQTGGDAQIAAAIAAHSGSLVDYTSECIDWLRSIEGEAAAGTLPPAIAARYWRAIAAGNLTGWISTARQVEAGLRAASLYRDLGKPRPVYSALMLLSLHQYAMGDTAAARASLHDARTLLRPDWPVEFHVMLLRREALQARTDGRYADALAFQREAVRQCRAAADWRLEVTARVAVVDSLWEAGAIDEAAREGDALSQELRERPPAPSDMDVHFTNMLGIHSERDDVEAATAAAREALPFIARTGSRSHEAWVHFYWRQGQHELAALLLGRCDTRSADHNVQSNEARLVEQARAGLAAAMDSGELAARQAAGAVMSDADVLVALARGLGGSG